MQAQMVATRIKGIAIDASSLQIITVGHMEHAATQAKNVELVPMDIRRQRRSRTEWEAAPKI